MHPFAEQLDLCEELIYFCARNRKAEPTPVSKPVAACEDAERDKRLQEEVKKGKVEVALSKAEREAQAKGLASAAGKGKTQRRKREGQASIYYGYDENRLDLDYLTIQKFASLEMSPPIDVDELAGVSDQLMALREALRVRGFIQQSEDKAKLTRDTAYTQSEEYTAQK